MYTKKIQVSRGIFHGISLEGDRQCSTCRNSRITEDARKIKSDFPRGYRRLPKLIFYLPNQSDFRRLSSAHQASTELECRNSRISEDVRQCSIFPEVTEEVSFAELVEFPKIVFFGTILDFSESFGFSRRLPKPTEDVLFVERFKHP